jgi:hypothetical protein
LSPGIERASLFLALSVTKKRIPAGRSSLCPANLGQEAAEGKEFSGLRFPGFQEQIDGKLHKNLIAMNFDFLRSNTFRRMICCQQEGITQETVAGICIN